MEDPGKESEIQPLSLFQYIAEILKVSLVFDQTLSASFSRLGFCAYVDNPLISPA